MKIGDTEVATYITDPQLDIRLAPRPYLHPVRTLAGTVVTDALCYDHPWHLGASVTLADVNGWNFWGGRTYGRDRGYTWLDDHGAIVHREWLPTRAGAGLAHALEWRDPAGGVLLGEERWLGAATAAGGWELTFAFTLTATRPIPLGSPATNGRPGGAGYGGFFWRSAPGPTRVFTADAVGEERVNGSAAPWLALTGAAPYTLVFRGLAGDDRWFVRTAAYPGVCAALAFDRALVVTPDAPLTRTYRVLIADGRLTPAQAGSG